MNDEIPVEMKDLALRGFIATVRIQERKAMLWSLLFLVGLIASPALVSLAYSMAWSQ